MHDTTIDLLLEQSGADGPAIDALVPLVYGELRSIAHRLLAAEHQPRGTLDTTALVHEAYLKLAAGREAGSHGRAYFFAAVARAMRQVLVETARRRQRHKRGAGQGALPLSAAAAVADDRGDEVLAIDQALDELAALYPRAAKVVECRFFAGLSVPETAEALGVSERTVKRDGSLAQAWLYRKLRGED